MNRNRDVFSAAVLALAIAVPGCGGDSSPAETAAGPISPRDMADALYAVIESDRTVYANQVVHRLQDEEAVIAASEHWRDEKALPLPAQMFRMGAELTAGKTDRFSYALLSKWPIQKTNAPKTEMELAGLDQVAEDPSRPFYGTETLGGVDYFTAVYPDIAVSPACIACHNAHKDSPRDDFEPGDTMGGVVIRIPLR
ncbi:MAG: DUF3365 domain-containing protein [Acidobacteriota bacterium]|nr:DUF3365 domain-containing protein [Acidobacteriota bacterium]